MSRLFSFVRRLCATTTRPTPAPRRRFPTLECLEARLAPSANPLADADPPPVATISGPSAPLTKGGPISFTVTYDDTNFDHSTLTSNDVTLNTTGTATGVVTVSAGDGPVRTVVVSNITGDGTIGLSLAADTAVDQAGNQAAAAGPSASVTADNSGPVVRIGLPSVSQTTRGPVVYSVTYSDPRFKAATLTAADVTLNRTGTAKAVVTVSGSGAARAIQLSGITGVGTLWVSLREGTATDTLGNLALAVGPSAAVRIGAATRVLKVSQSGPTLAKPGDTVSFDIAVSNAGSEPAFGVTLRQVLPAYATFNEAASSDGWVNRGGGVFTLDLGVLAAGQSAAPVNFAVTFAKNAPSGRWVTSRASVRDSLSPQTDLAVAVASLLIAAPARARWGR